MHGPAAPVVERVARRGDFVLRGHRGWLYKKVTSIVKFRKVKGDDDIYVPYNDVDDLKLTGKFL